MTSLEVIEFIKKKELEFQDLHDELEELDRFKKPSDNHEYSKDDIRLLKSIGLAAIEDYDHDGESFGYETTVMSFPSLGFTLMEEFHLDRTGNGRLSVSYHQVVEADNDMYGRYRKTKDLDEWSVP